MNVANSMGDHYRIARLSAANSNHRLGTYAGAAEEIGVESPDTVGRWERGESTPTNFNVKSMATLYQAPELLANYCALSCPIGQGRMMEVTLRPVEQLTLRLCNSSRGLEDDLQQLMRIAEDGEIDENERPAFDEILARLSRVSHIINSLQILAEKNKQRK